MLSRQLRRWLLLLLLVGTLLLLLIGALPLNELFFMRIPLRFCKLFVKGQPSLVGLWRLGLLLLCCRRRGASAIREWRLWQGRERYIDWWHLIRLLRLGSFFKDWDNIWDDSPNCGHWPKAIL